MGHLYHGYVSHNHHLFLWVIFHGELLNNQRVDFALFF